MELFKNEGTFTPDSLIAGSEFPILKEGIALKGGQGVLKRGTLICKGTDEAGYIAGSTVTIPAQEGGQASEMEMTVFGILTDDTDTGEDATATIPSVCYITGLFSRADVIVKTGSTVKEFEQNMKGVGMYLRTVQEY